MSSINKDNTKHVIDEGEVPSKRVNIDFSKQEKEKSDNNANSNIIRLI